MNESTRFRGQPQLIGLAALAAVLLAWRWFTHAHAADAATRTRSTATVVAVETATATTANVPVYLQGLGTVQAYYTVTVTPRIDGQLEQVTFKEGQDVRKGQLLAQIDPRPARAAYEQAVATKARDEAQLANARRDLARYKLLQPQDLTSKQTYDTQLAQVEQQTAQLKIDQAAIDSARTQLDYTRITSPIDGRTGIRRVDPGNNVHASDTGGIVVVTQLQPITVVFTLPEDTLPQLQAAMAAGKVAVAALARSGDTQLDQGTLSLIDNQIDQTSGTIKLKAVFDNAQRKLWPGQFVNARVLVRTARNALTVPANAVQVGADGPFVYLVQPDSTVVVRLVKISQQDNVRAVVTAGLKPGDQVVTSNQYRLQPGSHVRSYQPSSQDAARTADRATQATGGSASPTAGSAGTSGGAAAT